MKKMLFLMLAVLLTISLEAPFCMAAEITVTVDSKVGPWDWGSVLNSDYAYGINDHNSPVIIDETTGLSFAPGNKLTITYISGTVKAGGSSRWSWVDANGDASYVANGNKGSSGKYFPSKYMSNDWDTYLMALVGTFTDANGTIVGSPFEIGNGPITLEIPSGATQLQLGINDDKFYDNEGSFTIKIEGAAVPIPGTIWLLGSVFVGLIGLKGKKNNFNVV